MDRDRRRRAASTVNQRCLRVEQETRFGLFSKRLTAQDLQALLGINLATAYRWIKDPARIPALHLELLKIKALGLIPDPEFHGWCVKDGRLVSPSSKHYQHLTPGQLEGLAWAFQRARALDRELDDRNARIRFLEAEIDRWRLKAGEIPAANDPLM